MINFIGFLGQNILAAVIMVTSFIVDLFAIAKKIQEDGTKNIWRYLIAVLSMIFLISIGYLSIQYFVGQSGNGGFGNGDSIVSGEDLTDSDSSEIEGNTNIQSEGEYHDPEVEKSSGIVSVENPNDSDSSKNENITQDKDEHDDPSLPKNNNSVSVPNVGDSTREQGQENFKPTTTEGPYNSSSFTLDTRIAAGQMTINGYPQLFGISQDTQEKVTVKLIDYDTNRIIDTKYADIGDIIAFSDIANGTYYYAINCTGYKETISPNAFVLERNNNLPKDTLPWFTVLESNDNKYSTPFTIQVQTAQGDILKNTSVQIGAINAQDPYPNSYSAYQMITDENGYLTSWENVNGVDYYHLVTFQLASGYSFKVSTTNGLSGEVDVYENLGVCMVTSHEG